METYRRKVFQIIDVPLPTDVDDGTEQFTGVVGSAYRDNVLSY